MKIIPWVAFEPGATDRLAFGSDRVYARAG